MEEIRRLKHEGLSISKISELTGRDRGTVREYLDPAIAKPVYKPRSKRQSKLDPHKRLDLIVIDELGYVPFSKAGAELLFDVVGRAYERTSLMLTTNLPFEEWVQIMGSERLTGALLDRLTHRVHIIEANGPIYRLGEAKRRLKTQTGKREAEKTPGEKTRTMN